MVHVNIKDGLTSRQIERQKVREDGKYSNYEICELCGKKIIPGTHWSDARCNDTGGGLLLCGKKCCAMSEKMNNAKFLEVFCKNDDYESRTRHIENLMRKFPERE